MEGGGTVLPLLHDFNAAMVSAPFPLQDDESAPEMAESPAPAPAPVVATAAAPSAPVPLEVAWAKAWNLKWSRLAPRGSLKLTAKYALCFETSSTEQSEQWWVSCSKLYFDARMHPLQQVESDSELLQLVYPLRATPSVSVFQSLRAHTAVALVLVTLVPLTWHLDNDQLVARYNLAESTNLFTIHHGLEETIEACSASKDHAADAADAGAAGDDDGAGAGPAPRTRKRKSTGSTGAPPKKKSKLTPLELLRRFLRAAEPDVAQPETAEDVINLEQELEAVMEGTDGMEDDDESPEQAEHDAPAPAAGGAVASAVPAFAIDCPRVGALVEDWRTKFADGLDALEKRHASLCSWDPTRRREHLSLCCMQKDGLLRVDLWHWIRTPSKDGYAIRVYIDRANGVKYSVTNSLGEVAVDLDTALSTGAATMIMPDCGVPMHKGFRLALPSAVDILRKMWTRALDEPDGVAYEFCETSGVTDANPIHVCPLCGVSCHSDCGARISAHLVSGKQFGAPPAAIAGAFLPTWWLLRLCPMCKHTQGL